jgi:hypothetical protein
MVALVSVETVLLVVLLVLVAGLLRSHAELLRRVGPAAERDPALPEPPATPRAGAALAASPLQGTTPRGEPVALSFGGPGATPTLLAFLTSGCGTCAGFWETLGDQRLPGVQTVIVTRGSDREQPARLASLAPQDVPVVMSSVAWEEYSVPGAPYFVLVDGHIRGEGVATGWPALASLVGDALADAGWSASSGAGPERAAQVEAKLAAAGIRPGDPSLYPGRVPAP